MEIPSSKPLNLSVGVDSAAVIKHLLMIYVNAADADQLSLTCRARATHVPLRVAFMCGWLRSD